jgi:hypothetical protein
VVVVAELHTMGLMMMSQRRLDKILKIRNFLICTLFFKHGDFCVGSVKDDDMA